MSIFKKGKMKKIYSRPMMEIEPLMGERLLQESSLRVFTNPEDEFVDDFDDLLSDRSSLWDEDEEDGKEQ